MQPLQKRMRQGSVSSSSISRMKDISSEDSNVHVLDSDARWFEERSFDFPKFHNRSQFEICDPSRVFQVGKYVTVFTGDSGPKNLRSEQVGQ